MKKFLSIIALLLLTSQAYAELGRSIIKGSTSQRAYVRIINATTGIGETGVTSATSGIDLEYVRLGAAPVDITEVNLTTTSDGWTSGGIIHLGGGNYRIDLPDAACTSTAGVNQVMIQGTITGMIVIPTTHPLIAFDIYDADPAVNVEKILDTQIVENGAGNLANSLSTFFDDGAGGPTTASANTISDTYGLVGLIKAQTDKFGAMVTGTAPDYAFDAAAIAGIWDTTLTSHVVVDSAAMAMKAIREPFDANGTRGTLELSTLNITNSAGTAVTIAGGSNGDGIAVSGDGTGSGINTMGGTSGHGLLARGNTTAGTGIGISAAGGATSGSGIQTVGSGSASGLIAMGGTSGHGIFARGNNASGTGNGINVTGGSSTGYGINVTTTDGHAIYVDAGGTSKAGINILSGTDYAAVRLLADGSGSGLLSIAGLTGHGIHAMANVTPSTGSGSGLRLEGGGSSGNGVKVTTTSGHGVDIDATGTNMDGLLVDGGTGTGVDIRGDLTGNITGNLSGSVGSLTSLAANSIAAATFQAGAINAAAIGTAAIDADAIATDAIGALEIAADAIASSELAATAASEIATAVSAVWAGATVELTPAAIAAIADGVWDELKSGHTTPDSFGDYLDDEISEGGNTAAIATAVWATALPGTFTAGQAGNILPSIATKTDFLPSATAGTAGGVLIAGANADTTFATITSTGNFTVNGNITVAQSGDSYSRLGSPAGASISADIAAIENQTDDIGVAGAGLTAIDATATITPADITAIAEETAAAVGTEVADGVWDYIATSASAPGSMGLLINNNLNATVGSRAAENGGRLQNVENKTAFLPNATAGATGGLLIAGSNAATTFASLNATAMTIAGVGNAAQTGDSFVRIGANGASLTALPWNATWDTELQSEADDALRALHLHHLFESTYNSTSKPGTAASLLNVLVENDAGVPRFTANALEQAPSGTGSSPEVIADAVWDEAKSGHNNPDSYGDYLDDEISSIVAGSGLNAQQTRDAMLLAPSGAAVAGSIDAQLAAIPTLAAFPANFIDLAIEAGTGKVTTDVEISDEDIEGIADAVGTPAQVHNQAPVPAFTSKLGTRADGVVVASPTQRIIPGEINQRWIDCSALLNTNIEDVTSGASSNPQVTVQSTGMIGKFVSVVFDASDAEDGDTLTFTCNVVPIGGQVIKATLSVVCDDD